jgi:hypothetical protein
VPSRSIFFFNRRNAFSTDSPFFSLISVKQSHFLSGGLGKRGHHGRRLSLSQGGRGYFCRPKSQWPKRPAPEPGCNLEVPPKPEWCPPPAPLPSVRLRRAEAASAAQAGEGLRRTGFAGTGELHSPGNRRRPTA